MGLFGSKTTVVQSASNTTNVDVGVELQNIIDMSGIEKVMQAISVIFQSQVDATGASTQATIQGAVTLSDAFKQVSAEQAKQVQSIEAKISPWAKLIAAGVIVWLGTKIWKLWR